MKRYSIGVVASVAPDVAFMAIEEVVIEVGNVEAKTIGLGLGGEESPPPLVTSKPLERAPDPLSVLVTFTLHNPTAAPEIGHSPLDSVDELVKVKLAQDISVCPDFINLTVAPDWKFEPVTEVIARVALFGPEAGLIAVTAGAFEGGGPIDTSEPLSSLEVSIPPSLSIVSALLAASSRALSFQLPLTYVYMYSRDRRKQSLPDQREDGSRAVLQKAN